jgi:hypothetical protein
MWKLYAGAGKGVAICSKLERMRVAFPPFRLAPGYGPEDIWAGQVRYEDLLKVRMNVGMLERFFHKHRAFAWEREFRLAISLRMAEEAGVAVPDQGVEVAVDVNALVDCVMLGPSLVKGQHEQIIQAAEKAGLGDRLAKSSLLGWPRYV